MKERLFQKYQFLPHNTQRNTRKKSSQKCSMKGLHLQESCGERVVPFHARCTRLSISHPLIHRSAVELISWNPIHPYSFFLFSLLFLPSLFLGDYRLYAHIAIFFFSSFLPTSSLAVPTLLTRGFCPPSLDPIHTLTQIPIRLNLWIKSLHFKKRLN